MKVCLVIGGPAAGQRIFVEGDSVRIPVPSHDGFGFGVVEYVRGTIVDSSGQSRAVMVLRDTDAIAELMQFYADHAPIVRAAAQIGLNKDAAGE